MTPKKKNIAYEPSQVYETTPKIAVKSEELHPVLVKLLEKSILEADEGKLIPHDAVMNSVKEKIATLK